MDATSPTALGWAGIVTGLASAIVLLWRASRTDKDAQIAAQAAEIKTYQDREAKFWQDREESNESRLRLVAAVEAIAVRLAALESKVIK